MLDFYYFVYVIYKYMYIISSVHTVCLCQRTPQAFNVHFNKLDLGFLPFTSQEFYAFEWILWAEVGVLYVFTAAGFH